MVEEHGVHRLADRVVAAEGEGKVGNTAGGQRARQVPLDPADSLDEVHAVAGVLRDAGADGQDVDVEDDLPRLVTGLLREQPERPFADGNLAVVGRGLALLVEGHHHHGGAQAADFPRLGEETLLPFLQGDGIDDAAALGILEPGEQRLPVGRIDHQGGARHGRIAGDLAQEALHLDGAVQHRVVHVDVDDGRAVVDLPGSDLQGRIIVACGDEFGKFARAGHVGALADVGEAAVAHVQRDGLQAAHGQAPVLLRAGTRRDAAHGRRDGADVLRRGAAAAADDVDEPVLRHPPEGGGRLFGRLVVGAHLVGQAGVGVAADGAAGPGSHVRDERGQFFRAQRAVEPEAQRPGVLHRPVERLQRLSGQGPSAAVAGRHGDQQRERSSLRNAADGVDGGLGVERVEAGLQQQRVHAAFQQPADLLRVGFGHLVEGIRPEGRVRKVLRQGQGLAGGADRAGHPDRPAGGVGFEPGQPGARPGEFARLRGAVVFRLGNAVGAEGVGRNDVRAGFDVGAVDVPDGLGTGQVERLAVAGQAVALEHRAHRSVQDQDPAGQRLFQPAHQKQSLRMLTMLALRPIV